MIDEVGHGSVNERRLYPWNRTKYLGIRLAENVVFEDDSRKKLRVFGVFHWGRTKRDRDKRFADSNSPGPINHSRHLRRGGQDLEEFFFEFFFVFFCLLEKK